MYKLEPEWKILARLSLSLSTWWWLRGTAGRFRPRLCCPTAWGQQTNHFFLYNVTFYHEDEKEPRLSLKHQQQPAGRGLGVFFNVKISLLLPSPTQFLFVASLLLCVGLMQQLNCQVKERTSNEASRTRRVVVDETHAKKKRKAKKKKRAQQQAWFIDRVAFGFHRLPLRQDASLVEGLTGTVKGFWGLKIGGACDRGPFWGFCVLCTGMDLLCWKCFHFHWELIC